MENVYTDMIKGNIEGFKKGVEVSLKEGNSPDDILNDFMVPAMDEVGRKFEIGELFIPEMLVAAKTMKAGVEVLRPHFAGSTLKTIGTYIIGTVKGDLHDIGKNLVKMMLEGVGFNVIDLGVNVSIETYVEAARKHKPEFLGICTLLTTTMPEARNVILALEEAGLREKVKVMVGGAPVSKQFSDDIGCDLFADNAGAAASVAKANISTN